MYENLEPIEDLNGHLTEVLTDRAVSCKCDFEILMVGSFKHLRFFDKFSCKNTQYLFFWIKSLKLFFIPNLK